MESNGLKDALQAVFGKVRSTDQFGRDMRELVRSRSRPVLTVACVVSGLLFWLAAEWWQIPPYYAKEPSLIRQPHAAAVLLLVGFVLWIAVAVATVIAGGIRLDAGLFAGAVGLGVLRVRGGPMRYVFQSAGGAGVMLSLLLELLVLYGFFALAWYGVWTLHRRGGIEGDALRDGLADQEHTLGERVVAAATQVGTMAVLTLLLAQTDDTKQAMAAVFCASLLATLLAYAFSPVRPSVWYWAGPLAVGAVGYAAGYLNWGRGGPSVWKAGLAAGFLAPLARPVPLDYASAGPAGAILGYWLSRRWQRAKELELEAEANGAADRDASGQAPGPAGRA
jgi:hypothetical protein